MSLQEIIAGLIAAGCGAWAVWYVIRPFASRIAAACGCANGSCEPPRSRSDNSDGEQTDLIQIAPPDDS